MTASTASWRPAARAGECDGRADVGFGLLFNWNLLGDGEHTVRALADGVEFARATFTVTTLGDEFVRGASGATPPRRLPHRGRRAAAAGVARSLPEFHAGSCRPRRGSCSGG